MKLIIVSIITFICSFSTVYAVPYKIPIAYSPVYDSLELDDHIYKPDWMFVYVFPDSVDMLAENPKFTILTIESYYNDGWVDPNHPSESRSLYTFMYITERNEAYYVLNESINFAKTPIDKMPWKKVNLSDEMVTAIAEIAFEMKYNEEYFGAEYVKRFPEYDYEYFDAY